LPSTTGNLPLKNGALPSAIATFLSRAAKNVDFQHRVEVGDRNIEVEDGKFAVDNRNMLFEDNSILLFLVPC
jgi:hypothetical protein